MSSLRRSRSCRQAIIPTGPADPAESWQLVVAEAANTAPERLWIASPYFVPDGGVLTALLASGDSRCGRAHPHPGEGGPPSGLAFYLHLSRAGSFH